MINVEGGNCNSILFKNIMEIEGGKRILTDYMEVDIIEIPKIYELKETDKFLENPESERVKSIMKEKGMDISTIVELTGLTEEQIKVI